MTYLPQNIAILFLLVALVGSVLIDVDHRKFRWVIGFAILAGLLFALDVSNTPIKWHPVIGVLLAFLLPPGCLMIGGIMSLHTLKAEKDRIKMLRFAHQIRKQFYIDILGKDEYEKYITSQKNDQKK